MRPNEKLRDDIVRILTEDSRKSFRAIAKELGVSTTTVSKVVGRLEHDGIIQKYTAQVDWHRLGYESLMCLQIETASNADLDKVGKALRRLSSVKQVFYTTGGTSFSVYVVCKNNNEATETLDELRHIQGIERVVPHIVLRTF
jgi:Lrp/AsnC family transcriptional regulator for asnA, asnC and gidA